MLIRSYNDELVEYPDDLVALMLASPLYGNQDDDPDFSLAELNCMVHAMLGTFYDDSLTHDQNIERIRETYTAIGAPTSKNLEKAWTQIKFYNENIAKADIGRSDRETMRTVFGFDGNSNKSAADNVIDQDMKPVADVPILGNSNTLQHHK